MSDKFSPRIGGILSADIAVPEHNRELRFYSRVLRTGDTPLWDEQLLSSLGFPIIGLGKREGGYADLPLQWMPHIQVANVAASVQKALELGGSEVMHGKDDSGASQWAVLTDPNGAAFGIIPLVPAMPLDGNAGGEPTAPFGHIFWVDMTVSDAADLRDFYSAVIGWGVDEVEMQDGDEAYTDYIMTDGKGNPAAGICHARGMNTGIPPVWILYLPVGDKDESLRLVPEEGGKVLKTSGAEDHTRFYAVIEDPVGVAFALVSSSS